MTSLIAPSDMTVHSHYNSFRTSMFNASSYASSLSSFSDDDEFKPLYISDDEEAKEVEAKLSRRTSRVKSKGSPDYITGFSLSSIVLKPGGPKRSLDPFQKFE